MRQVKTLGLAAIAATVFMTFVSVASATTLTSPAGSTYTSTITAESNTVGISGSFTTVTCRSIFSGKVEYHGSSGAGGKLSKLSFSMCNYPVAVQKAGSIEISSNGMLSSSGAEFSIETSVGTCVFTTNGTSLGFIWGGSPASIGFGAKVPRTGGSFFCGSSGNWTGSYNFYVPGTLYVD